MNAKLWIYRGLSVKIYMVVSLNSRVLTKGMGGKHTWQPFTFYSLWHRENTL